MSKIYIVFRSIEDETTTIRAFTDQRKAITLCNKLKADQEFNNQLMTNFEQRWSEFQSQNKKPKISTTIKPPLLQYYLNRPGDGRLQYFVDLDVYNKKAEELNHELSGEIKRWKINRDKFRNELASNLSDGKYTANQIEEMEYGQDSYWYDIVELDENV